MYLHVDEMLVLAMTETAKKAAAALLTTSRAAILSGRDAHNALMLERDHQRILRAIIYPRGTHVLIIKADI